MLTHSEFVILSADTEMKQKEAADIWTARMMEREGECNPCLFYCHWYFYFIINVTFCRVLSFPMFLSLTCWAPKFTYSVKNFLFNFVQMGYRNKLLVEICVYFTSEVIALHIYLQAELYVPLWNLMWNFMWNAQVIWCHWRCLQRTLSIWRPPVTQGL